MLPFTLWEKVMFLSVTLIFISALISSQFNESSLARADRFYIFVLVIPAYIFFKHNNIEEKYIWTGLVAGSLITMIVAMYQVFGPPHLAKATGSTHAILYGDLSLIMGTLSLAGVSWFHRQKRWMAGIPYVAFVAALLASALSLSRGGWVALPLLVMVLVWYSTRYLSYKKIATIIGLTFLIFGAIYLVPQTHVQTRVAISIDQVNQYLNSTEANDPARETSIGLRFEMWKAAWMIFNNNPVVGIGWGNYPLKTKQLIDEGHINKRVSRFYHAHNQYLSALAKGGVLGFVSLLFLLICPGVIFYKYMHKKYDDGVNHIALAGLLFVAGFACFGLTEAILEKSRSIVFYSFYLAVFAAMLRNKLQCNRL